MTDIAKRLAVSTSTVIRKLNEFQFKTDWSWLPENMSWDEYRFKKGKMSFIAQDFDSLKVITILDGRTQATIRNHFQRYSRQTRNRVTVMTMDMFPLHGDMQWKVGNETNAVCVIRNHIIHLPNPSLSNFQAQAEIVSQTISLPHAKIVLDRFHIVQHLIRAMNRVRIQIMNQLDRQSQEYRALKRYWKQIQQDSRKLNDKRFYRPTFRAHLTNKEMLEKLLSYSDELRQHYELYQ